VEGSAVAIEHRIRAAFIPWLRHAATACLALLPCATARAQTEVRAWAAAGQVFVVWKVDATVPLTYDVYRSASPVTSTSQATLAGRVFQPEWGGDRLKLVSPNATWRIPTANGGSYQLASNEGLFVYTPRAAATEHFAVVRNGSTAISDTNRTQAAVAVGYDPANQPIRCHLQRSGTSSRGYPYKTWALWVDGRNDPNDARPDFPVMANAAKAGAPHVFTVFEPKAGLPPGPYPAVVCLHGGGQYGSHWAFEPEGFHYGNDEPNPVDGVTIAMDDRLFISTNGVVNTDRPTNWFGWHTGMDPLVNSVPSSNAVVVPYTLRRLAWTVDWLQTRSPYAIDPSRTAVMGNSMGGAGTLLFSRFLPERFSAATAFVPQHYTPETGQRLFGTTAQNLRTTEVGPDGTPLRVNDFFDPKIRLSSVTRDSCLTRIFRGRLDQTVEWGSLTLQLFNDMSNGRFGTHLYWDNRDHTASDWTTDDPQVAGRDIGEWVSPVLTSRSGAPYQGRFRCDQSYPGFFNDDQNPALSGRQPTLGNGSPTDGTPWGTWCGYFDWDTETIFDTTSGWSCTLFLVGRSSVSVDNFPGTSATTSLTLRKPRKLWPMPGATITWTLRDDLSDLVLQSGTVQAETDSLVAVTGLVVPKDPQRVRLELRVAGAPRTGDLNQDGRIDYDDVRLLQANPVDLDGDGLANASDAAMLQRYVLRNGCAADLDGNRAIDGGDIAILLLEMGPCGTPCPADVDGSGMVDAGDLGLALLDWGPCG
jgi:predicted esterase